MTFGLIAFHYPRPEYSSEMVARVAAAAEIMTSAPGCLKVDYWREEASGAIVATATFETKQACLDALAAAAATADIAYDERESRPREVYHLVEAEGA